MYDLFDHRHQPFPPAPWELLLSHFLACVLLSHSDWRPPSGLTVVNWEGEREMGKTGLSSLTLHMLREHLLCA